MKERTAKTWKSHLQWINPRIGSTPLSEVNNLVLRDLVEQMSEAGFTPKTILNYTFVVKAVVASAIGKDGEPLYPRKWNHEFMDLPEVGDQRTPTFTAREVEQIIALADSQCGMLYTVLAASGLRIGEALALKVTDFQDSTLSIRQSIWNGRTTSPKTRFAVREVDLPIEIAEMLTSFIADRKDGYIFQSRKGTALGQRNLLGRSLHPILKTMKHEPVGFHAFRRFRVTYLRRQRRRRKICCASGLDMATRRSLISYQKLREDENFRKSVAEEVGIGFSILASCPQWSPKVSLEAGLEVLVN